MRAILDFSDRWIATRHCSSIKNKSRLEANNFAKNSQVAFSQASSRNSRCYNLRSRNSPFDICCCKQRFQSCHDLQNRLFQNWMEKWQEMLQLTGPCISISMKGSAIKHYANAFLGEKQQFSVSELVHKTYRSHPLRTYDSCSRFNVEKLKKRSRIQSEIPRKNSKTLLLRKLALIRGISVEKTSFPKFEQRKLV